MGLTPPITYQMLADSSKIIPCGSLDDLIKEMSPVSKYSWSLYRVEQDTAPALQNVKSTKQAGQQARGERLVPASPLG